MTSGALKPTGGGTFDPDEGPINFTVLSGKDADDAMDLATHVLLALNELDSDNSFKRFEMLLNSGRHKVFLDSGIYAINAAYMREHPENQNSMALPPAEMPGFAELRARYVSVVKKYEHLLWGYVELDQGGTAWKPRTRADLEAEGIRPMPVYHPMIDPPEYFDELASQYDRICVGCPRLIMVRKRLYTTIYERWQKYRHRLKWIHLLGFNPSHLARSFPFSSYDSSTWTEPMRWGIARESADGKLFSTLPQGYLYSYDEDADLHGRDSNKATRMAMLTPHSQQIAFRHRVAEMQRMGFIT